MLGADRLQQQMELLRSSLMDYGKDKSKVTTGTGDVAEGRDEDEDDGVAMLIEEWLVKVFALLMCQ
jgi:hypothetical protein